MSINQICISKMVLLEIKKINIKPLNAFLFTRKKTKQKQNADNFLFEKEREEAKLVKS